MKNFFRYTDKAQDLFDISGDFGRIEGELTTDANGFYAAESAVKAYSKTLKHKSGVISRIDTVTNDSDKDINLNKLASKFIFCDGEYEVYTQYNGWCNESQGSWQPLTSGIFALNTDLRNSHNAAPILALRNKQTGRGMVFHLLPHSAFMLSAQKVDDGAGRNKVVVSLGISGGFSINLKPNESFSLPEILCYEFTSKIDLDCHKLHEYCMDRFSIKEMPVIFNTWLAKNDKITYENVTELVDKAAALGAEYFVIDAGWFGNQEAWWNCVGDWVERTRDRLRGKMKDIADNVHNKGMGFGLWFEVERADWMSEIKDIHPEYFIKEGDAYFLDFNRLDALNYINGIIDELIERIGIDFIKFDFNADMTYDPENTAFVNYYKGYDAFISALRKRHPKVYFENCASGGQRMNLVTCENFDGVWFTDNQSVYHSTRIYKDTILRMPPQLLEKFATFETRDDFLTYEKGLTSKIISTDDAKWCNIRGVNLSYLKAFLRGSRPCFSCDLTRVDDDVLKTIANIVEEYKSERDFWKNATCRILCDADAMLVLQYTNLQTGEIKLQAISDLSAQREVHIYPVVESDIEYLTDAGEKISAKELNEYGLYLKIEDAYTATEFSLKPQK